MAHNLSIIDISRIFYWYLDDIAMRFWEWGLFFFFLFYRNISRKNLAVMRRFRGPNIILKKALEVMDFMTWISLMLCFSPSSCSLMVLHKTSTRRVGPTVLASKLECLGAIWSRNGITGTCYACSFLSVTWELIQLFLRKIT